MSACVEEEGEEPEKAVVKAMEPVVVHRKTSKLKRHRHTAGVGVRGQSTHRVLIAYSYILMKFL